MIFLKTIRKIIGCSLQKKLVTGPQDIRKINKKEKLFIVSTGLTAKEFWSNAEFRASLKEWDICLLNDCFFEYWDQTKIIKPRYYCIVDSAYWGNDSDCGQAYVQKIRQNMEKLKEVDWPLYMIIPAHRKILVDNPNITYIYLNTFVESQIKSRFWFYDRNMMKPCGNTVVHWAVYYGILSRYEMLGILGLEYNFTRSLSLDTAGQAYFKMGHSYEKGTSVYELKNDSDYRNAREGMVSKFFEREAETLAGFAYLREYADFSGVRIVNYSRDTLVDAFELEEC